MYGFIKIKICPICIGFQLQIVNPVFTFSRFQCVFFVFALVLLKRSLNISVLFIFLNVSLQNNKFDNATLRHSNSQLRRGLTNTKCRVIQVINLRDSLNEITIFYFEEYSTKNCWFSLKSGVKYLRIIKARPIYFLIWISCTSIPLYPWPRVHKQIFGRKYTMNTKMLLLW